MKHLISREDYINEYLHISEYIKNENELYEGLLSTVFGGLKMLLKKDWASIKCKNPSVLTYLKEIDKSLSGYTMTKMQFSAECNNIRQNIADYFNDILDYKLLQIEKEENVGKYLENEDKEIEENTEDKGVAKYLNIKDKTLLDSLKKYKENISTSCKKSSKLKEYADQMLNSVIIFVNDIIIKELEKKGADKEKEKLKKQKKKLEEERKKLEEERKKKDEEAKKANEEAIKKLSKERDDSLRKLGIKPIGAMDGDKSIDVITKQFADMLGEFKGLKLNESALPKGYSEVLRSDTYIGISKSLEELNWNFSENEVDNTEAFYDKFLIKVILNKINTTFEEVAKNKDRFKGVPSASVQAMMVSLANAVIYGFMGREFNIENDDRLTLMTKCVIDSDATIGFNLPLIDPQKPDNGNFFVSIMYQFKDADISSKEVEYTMENMTEKELEMVEKGWKGRKTESEEKSDKGNSNDEKTEEPKADPKNKDKFAKEFGSMIMKDFRQNMSNLFDTIVDWAKEVKEDAENTREAEAAKAQKRN